MNEITKEFIEDNLNLIDSSNWTQLFIKAYNESLENEAVFELAVVLDEANVFDSLNLRSNLLKDFLETEFSHLRVRLQKPRKVHVPDHYLIDFLRENMNNLFGFTEEDTVDFIVNNQENFRISLKERSLAGQHQTNYEMTIVR